MYFERHVNAQYSATTRVFLSGPRRPASRRAPFGNHRAAQRRYSYRRPKPMDAPLPPLRAGEPRGCRGHAHERFARPRACGMRCGSRARVGTGRSPIGGGRRWVGGRAAPSGDPAGLRCWRLRRGKRETAGLWQLQFVAPA